MARRDGVPRIGGHVDIGAGARVLGPVVLGNHVEIGANAVFLADVPPHHVALGAPASVLAPGRARPQPLSQQGAGR